MPIRVQSQKSMPLAPSAPPMSSAEAPDWTLTSSMSQRVMGKKAAAASTPETIRPLYSACSTLPVLLLTANVPMIEAMIDTPPITSGYTDTSPSWLKVSTPRSITATAVTA